MRRFPMGISRIRCPRECQVKCIGSLRSSSVSPARTGDPMTGEPASAKPATIHADRDEPGRDNAMAAAQVFTQPPNVSDLFKTKFVPSPPLRNRINPCSNGATRPLAKRYRCRGFASTKLWRGVPQMMWYFDSCDANTMTQQVPCDGTRQLHANGFSNRTTNLHERPERYKPPSATCHETATANVVFSLPGLRGRHSKAAPQYRQGDDCGLPLHAIAIDRISLPARADMLGLRGRSDWNFRTLGRRMDDPGAAAALPALGNIRDRQCSGSAAAAWAVVHAMALRSLARRQRRHSGLNLEVLPMIRVTRLQRLNRDASKQAVR